MSVGPTLENGVQKPINNPVNRRRDLPVTIRVAQNKTYDVDLTTIQHYMVPSSATGSTLNLPVRKGTPDNARFLVQTSGTPITINQAGNTMTHPANTVNEYVYLATLGQWYYGPLSELQNPFPGNTPPSWWYTASSGEDRMPELSVEMEVQ